MFMKFTQESRPSFTTVCEPRYVVLAHQYTNTLYSLSVILLKVTCCKATGGEIVKKISFTAYVIDAAMKNNVTDFVQWDKLSSLLLKKFSDF